MQPAISYIVGIGGSSGALNDYRQLLHALPCDTSMAFVIIAHMSPDHKSLLPEILSWTTRMSLAQATEGMPILPNHVYIIPPNATLFIENFKFKIISPRTMRGGRHNQVDSFFQSLAKHMKTRAIGIILSGGDGDGTAGCIAIKALGGTTIAQDLSAQVDSMPLNAQASGCVDFVMSPLEISTKLISLARQKTLDPSSLQLGRT